MVKKNHTYLWHMFTHMLNTTLKKVFPWNRIFNSRMTTILIGPLLHYTDLDVSVTIDESYFLIRKSARNKIIVTNTYSQF